MGMRREPSGGSARNTRKWVGAIAVIVLTIAAAVSVGSAGAKTSGGAQAKATTNLTMWFWGEDDAPGANKWLAAAVKSYEAKNPSIKIKVVAQPVATFIATFQAAAAAKSGPDVAAQWATGPVLTQVWGGAMTAISDLIPKSETKNWLNTGENTYAGKIWAMPLYLIGIPWMYNKALMKEAGITDYPATKWSQIISYCKTLRAKNIVPFAFGNDTFWTTQLMTQDLNKLSDVVDADTGKASFTSKKYAHFEDGWKQMVDAKCFNDDVSSVPLAKGQQAFDAGKVAMTIATDGQARTFAKDLGGDSKVTVAKWPVFGTGALKNLYNATQSTSYFVTSWSKHKKEGAAFLKYLHTAAQLKAWYAATGTPPADKRFDTAAITGALDKKLYAFNTTGKQIWLQNFFPPQVDLNGNAPAQQQLLGGRGDGAAAAAIRERAAKQWRAQQAAQLKNWQAFKPV
jgi:raffinose/stachyose/melibiose transport system substrate-binding protein